MTQSRKNGVYVTISIVEFPLAAFAGTGRQPVNQYIEEKAEKNKPEDQELAAEPEIGRDAEDIWGFSQGGSWIRVG